MSESSKSKTKTRFQSIAIIIAVLVFILGLGYVGGYFLMPGMIESAYQNKDCNKVLSLDGLYIGWYPDVVANKEIAGLAMECAVYTQAIRSEEMENWQDTYNIYRVYLNTYPQGLFTADAHARAANVLMSIVKDEISREKYSEAISNIDSLLNEYGDTETAAAAGKLRFDLYISLGKFLRETGDFTGAEYVFKDVNAWAREKNDVEYFNLSQFELSQTYLEWGLELQAQGKFTDALDKFSVAISPDPVSSSNSELAAVVRDKQASLYAQWGDHLIVQKDYANAMERYKTAASLSEDQSKANDLIANGYLRWASEVVAGEDFFGALVLLDFAEKVAVTDSTRNLVNDTRADLYGEFSKSQGKQAQKAMDDAIRIVCEHHIQPRLSIFGVDNEETRVGIYGVSEQLPNSLAATTPGSLHYVACIEKDSKIVSKVGITVSSQQFNPNNPPGVMQVNYHRIKNMWNVVMRKIDTGDEIDITVIEGSEPPTLGNGASLSALNWYGSEPDFADLVNWISSVVKE